MRAILLMACGFFLALAIGVGTTAYQTMTHPLEAIQNEGFSVVQVSDSNGKFLCEIHKGEAKLLPYGEYTITIPDTKTTFGLFKNNRGNPILHSVNGILVVETDANSRVMTPRH